MSDDNSDRFSLSRRKALAGMGGIGMAGALGLGGTYAQFTDTEGETVSFSAGGVDGEIEIGASYNGNDVLSQDDGDFISEVENVSDGGTGVAISFDDIKPGDFGCFSFNITVENNPAWAAACIDYEDSVDGEVFEPETHVDGDVDSSQIGTQGVTSNGELEENMLVMPFYKPPVTSSTPEKFDPCVFYDENTEEFSIENYEGSDAVGTSTQFWSNSKNRLKPQTLETAASAKTTASTVFWAEDDDNYVFESYDDTVTTDRGCVFLNGNPNEQTDNTQDASALLPGTGYGFGWDWHLPFDTGNEAQGDEITLNLGFVFAQERHTESPELSNVFDPTG